MAVMLALLAALHLGHGRIKLVERVVFEGELELEVARIGLKQLDLAVLERHKNQLHALERE